jgi:hypothetical protein
VRAIRRTILATALAAAALAVGPGAASACNDPIVRFSGTTPAGPGPGSPSEAGPGDSVAFVIGDAKEDASWSVSIAGRHITSGTGSRGDFVMPELGGESREVSVDVVVAHASTADDAGGPWPISFDVRYRGPATAPASPTSQPAEAPAAAPRLIAPEKSEPKQPATGSHPDGTGGATPQGGAPPASGPGGPGGTDSPSSPAGPNAGRAEPAAATVEARPSGATRRSDRSPALARAVLVIPDRVMEGSERESAVASLRSVDDEDIAATSVVIAIGIVLLLGAGGAGALALLRRRPAAPRPGMVVKASEAEVEAELQEMIAEQRLRESEEARRPGQVVGPASRDGPG